MRYAIYQSLVISEQDLFLVIAAAISPFLLEFGGFNTLTRAGFEQSALKKLEEKVQGITQHHEDLKRLQSADPNDPEVSALVEKTASAQAFLFRGSARSGVGNSEITPLLK